MKKRIISLVLAIVMLVSLAACGSDAGGAANTDKKMTKLSIATGNSGGTVYYIGAGMGNVLSEAIPDMVVTTEATNGGAAENCAFVNDYADMIGLAALDGVQAAYEGSEERGANAPHDKLRVMMIGHMTTVYIAADAKAGVETVADFDGKSIGWPAAGSSAYYVMKEIVEAYGYNMDDLNTRPISISDQVDAMKDGQLDVFSGAGAIPMAGCTELALSCDVKFISLDDDAINEKILAANPSWLIDTLPAGTYEGQDYDVKLVRIPMALICNADMDEDLAYQITKALCENTEDVAAVHGEGQWWSAENTMPYIDDLPVPLHPGPA